MAVLVYRTRSGETVKVSPTLGNVGVVGLDEAELRSLDPDDAGAIGYMLVEGMRQARGEHPITAGEFDVNRYIDLLRELQSRQEVPAG